MPFPDSPVAVDALRSGHSRRLGASACTTGCESQREANGTAFDRTGRSTTRGASTQLRGLRAGPRSVAACAWRAPIRAECRAVATNADPWVIGLRRRRPPLVVAVALANKTARIAWAVMHRHENYRRVAAAA